MTDVQTIIETLRENADLTEKAIEFMSDPEQIEEAKADVELWRAASRTPSAATSPGHWKLLHTTFAAGISRTGHLAR